MEWSAEGGGAGVDGNADLETSRGGGKSNCCGSCAEDGANEGGAGSDANADLVTSGRGGKSNCCGSCGEDGSNEGGAGNDGGTGVIAMRRADGNTSRRRRSGSLDKRQWQRRESYRGW